MEDIKFDVLIYTTEDVADVFNGAGDAIRVGDLTASEAKALIDILHKRNINICLIPV